MSFDIEIFFNHTPNSNPFFVFFGEITLNMVLLQKFYETKLKNGVNFEFGVNNWNKTIF